ncbi:MAG: Carboxylic ester hydrolase [Pseudonocardiales bacterium]|nr:Carboxylic ester hydrolase [Pseudonocardiales bacterium]
MTETRTTNGRVRGVRAPDDSLSFLGIPYGRADRFRAPAPAADWDGVFEADQFGPSCPQPTMPGAESEAALALFGGIPEPSMSEDCLVLNIWTASLTPSSARPVMVYFHGGGHATGSGSWPVYDGAALARRDAVVVTVNHRLGILGYLYLAHLMGPEFAASGAAGMLDLKLALEWVRDNIAAFGGDPANVGSKVAALMAMPSASALYHRAIIMSGWFGLEGKLPAEAETLTAQALELVGLDAISLAEALSMPVERLIAASAQMGGIDSGLNPVVDGSIIAAQPIDAVRSGSASDRPLIIGTVRDEYSMFLPFIAMFAGGPPDQAKDRYLRQTFGERTEAILDRYSAARPDQSIEQLRVAVATDGNVRMPALAFADAYSEAGGTVFVYRFDFESPLDPSLGAAHGLDVPFAFDTVNRAPVAGSGSTQKALASQMSSAWVAFARTGRPETGAVEWPAYTSAQRMTMLFGAHSSVGQDPAGSERRAWTPDGIS